MGSGLTEPKSEIKYTEAALVKVPTVASDTDSYRYAIQDGVNGFLARTPDEWYDCLTRLIVDSAERKRIGDAAYSHVYQRYSPEAMSNEARAVFDVIKNQP